MFDYSDLLLETADSGKLKHLEHPEDRILSGPHEYAKSFHALDAVHSSMVGHPGKQTHITTKYDGSPSLIFGHHPETGKFFVATKSAFNKEPKLNYTHADIVKNHPQGGLQQKLHTALKHLPEVAPKHGVYQGDIMYTHHDISNNREEKEHHFKPNTITYSIGKNTEEGKKISKAKIGMVVHTQYHGKTLESMKAHFNPDMSKFGSHEHVHLITPHADVEHSHYSPEAQQEYIKHMRASHEHFSKIPEAGHAVLAPHKAAIQQYINTSVRENKFPNIHGYLHSMERASAAKAATYKNPAAAAEHTRKSTEARHVVHLNQPHFEHMFAAHYHMAKAKDVLVHALSTHSTYGNSINGRPSKPEGFVATHHGYPTKLVHRAEFSHANLNKEGPNRFKNERPSR